MSDSANIREETRPSKDELLTAFSNLNQKIELLRMNVKLLIIQSIREGRRSKKS